MQDLRSDTPARVNMHSRVQTSPSSASISESEVPVHDTPPALRKARPALMVSTLERHSTVAKLSAEWDALADRTGGQPWVRHAAARL